MPSDPRRLAAAAAALVMLAAACGGGGTSPDTTGSAVTSPPASPTPTPVPARSVTSDDGLITVDVPEGALSEDVEVTARTLSEDELPPELASFELRGALHELGPPGTEFEVPVTVTRRVDVRQAGFDPADGMPLVVLGIRDGDGTWTFLADQEVSWDEETVEVRGTTTHFSTVVAFAGAAIVSMDPDDVDARVGATWEVEYRLVDRTGLPFPGVVMKRPIEPFVGDRGVVSLGRFTSTVFSDGNLRIHHGYRCDDVVGTDVFGARITVSEHLQEFVGEELIKLSIGIEVVPQTVQVTLMGTATCRESIVEELDIGRAVMCVFHSPPPPRYGSDWLSYVLSLFGFGPVSALPPDPELELTVEGANGDRPATAPIDEKGEALIVSGLASMGTKDIVEAVVRGSDGTTIDLTEAVIAAFGEQVVVGPEEGRVAGKGSCPPPLP
ncbi:MAG: hypothetical protein HY658_06765 [Actinobacteria bacterium]|nr:hypothetical protein [Actinomycetota bacterium]